MRPVQTFNNTKTDLGFPKLPSLPREASKDLVDFHKGLTDWYDDLIRVLRRDRDETLAKINELS
jgi:hypothetical protein